MNKCLKRDILNAEYKKRVDKNSSFSIAAFAKIVGVDASSVGKMLSGSRKITDKKFRQIAENLKLSESYTDAVLNQIKKETNPSEYFGKLEDEQFKVISDWYHFAILQLTYLENFNNDPKWIAKYLGIKHYEAKDAVERLLKLNFLKQSPCGRLIDNSEFANINKPNTSSIQKHQRGVLKQAYSSITEVPYESRAHSTLTLAVNKNKMKLIRSKMIQFKTEIDKIISEDNESKNDVYHLSLSFFPARGIGL